MTELKFRAVISHLEEDCEYSFRKYFFVEDIEIPGKDKFYKFIFSFFDFFYPGDGVYTRDKWLSPIGQEIVKKWLLSGGVPDRYTGRQDRNGIEIYENDIIQNIMFDCSSKSCGDGVVRYDSHNTRFIIKIIDKKNTVILSNLINEEIVISDNIYERNNLIHDMGDIKSEK